jgi:hypothetical protein
VSDTGGEVTPGVIDTGGKITPGIDPSGKFSAVINDTSGQSATVSLTLVVHLDLQIS